MTTTDYFINSRTIIFRWTPTMLIIECELSWIWFFMVCYCLITVVVLYSLCKVWESCCKSLPPGDCRLPLLFNHHSHLGELIFNLFSLFGSYTNFLKLYFFSAQQYFSSVYYLSPISQWKISSPVWLQGVFLLCWYFADILVLDRGPFYNFIMCIDCHYQFYGYYESWLLNFLLVTLLVLWQIWVYLRELLLEFETSYRYSTYHIQLVPC